MKKKIVVMGGGTGTFAVLSGLREYDHDLSAIVTMMDDGGSSGRLRDQLGVLPPGDICKCLVALSDDYEVWRRLLTYRFESGDLAGHSFGNIFLSALEKNTDTYRKALDEAHRVMDAQGRVLPVTYEQARLDVLYESGRRLEGEKLLDEDHVDKSRIEKMILSAPVHITEAATRAIMEADYIVLGPGDLYGSLIVLSLVEGVNEALARTQATFVYVLNLMTKSSQTYKYSASDHVRDVASYFGRSPDVILANTARIPQEVVDYYAQSSDIPVVDDLEVYERSAQVVRADVLSSMAHKAQDSALAATKAHSIVRHDPQKLAQVLQKIFV